MAMAAKELFKKTPSEIRKDRFGPSPPPFLEQQVEQSTAEVTLHTSQKIQKQQIGVDFPCLYRLYDVCTLCAACGRFEASSNSVSFIHELNGLERQQD